MSQAVVGKWRKTSTEKCSENYPDQLEFKANGLYSGWNEDKSRPIPLWDRGEYKILPGNKIRISTANDANIIYQYTLTKNSLTFVDANGCKFSYEATKS